MIKKESKRYVEGMLEAIKGLSAEEKIEFLTQKVGFWYRASGVWHMSYMEALDTQEEMLSGIAKVIKQEGIKENE